jgi:hypothetical protein
VTEYILNHFQLAAGFVEEYAQSAEMRKTFDQLVVKKGMKTLILIGAIYADDFEMFFKVRGSNARSILIVIMNLHLEKNWTQY